MGTLFLKGRCKSQLWRPCLAFPHEYLQIKRKTKYLCKRSPPLLAAKPATPIHYQTLNFSDLKTVIFPSILPLPVTMATDSANTFQLQVATNFFLFTLPVDVVLWFESIPSLMFFKLWCILSINYNQTWSRPLAWSIPERVQKVIRSQSVSLEELF